MADNKNRFDERSKDDLDKRLREINTRLGRDKEPEETETDKRNRNAYGTAFQLSSEFIAAILVGAIIGYGIDYFVGTTPWAMIVFVLLGFVAGVMNVMRAAGELIGPVDLGRKDKPAGVKEKD